MKKYAFPCLLWCVSLTLLASNVLAQGAQGQAAEILSKGLYCQAFDFLSGDFGLIIGLIIGFLGFMVLIFKEMHSSGFIMILAGVVITALPQFFETTFGNLTGMAANAGMGNQVFSSSATGRQSLRSNCDYDAVLTFIQDGTVIGSGNPYVTYDASGNPVLYNGDGTAGDFSQFGISAEDDFYTALGNRECNSGYSCVNQSGFMGRYQMGCAALTDAGYATGGTNQNCNFSGKNGVYDRASFLASQSAQEDAIRAYHQRVEGYLKNAGLWDRIGTTYNGQTITESGLIGAAHLSGVGNLKTYFNGSGWTDGNGTSPGEYIEIMNGRTVQ